MKRFLPVILYILLLTSTVLPLSAAETGSITVIFHRQDKPVAHAQFQIYRTAEWNGEGYTLVSPFSDYSVEIPDNLNDGKWKALAETLSAYAARDGVTPLDIDETDETGILKFENLTEGLYMLVGSPVQNDQTLILPQPILLTIPFTRENGTADYEIVTEPKYVIRSLAEKTVTRRALKVWKDDGNKSKRPTDITVQLLCNGEIYDEQTLSGTNNWRYTWEKLDAAQKWQVTEKTVPENYTVQVTQEGVTFTVINTNSTPPSPQSDEPKLPISPQSDEPKLPQTGMLWWPVPVLIGIGTVLVFAGILLLRHKKNERNTHENT